MYRIIDKIPIWSGSTWILSKECEIPVLSVRPQPQQASVCGPRASTSPFVTNTTSCAYRKIVTFLKSPWWWNPMRLLSFIRDGVMTWRRFPHYWPFVRGIHRSPVDSSYKRPVMRRAFPCHTQTIMRSFDVFFDVSLTKPLNKPPSSRWFVAIVCMALCVYVEATVLSASVMWSTQF